MLDLTDRTQWPGVPSRAEYRTPSRRGRPRGSIEAPAKVALLIWWARNFPIRPSRIFDALGFDIGQSQGERYIARAVARIEADLKADKPQFFAYPGHSWDRYVALPTEQRRRALLAAGRVVYPTPESLLDKIRQMPTVQRRHERREIKETYLDRDLD